MSRREQSKGISLVLFCLLSTLIFSFLALVIGLGFLMAGEVKLQNVTNLAALAAIQGYYQPVSGSKTKSERANMALQAADEVVADPINHPSGVTGYMGNLELYQGGPLTPSNSKGGLVVLGEWITKDSPNPQCTSPSGSIVDAPCFKPITNPRDQGSPLPTAVEVIAHTQSWNRVVIPFGKFVGVNDQELLRASVATIAPRCVAFAVDSSGSGALESHFFAPSAVKKDRGYIPTSPQDPVYRLTYQPDPTIPGKYAYREDQLPSPNPYSGCSSLGEPQFSSTDDYLDTTSSTIITDGPWQSGRHTEESVFWCAMKSKRPSSGVATDAHYQSDYVRTVTPAGVYYIDRYTLAEPFRSFMLGINQGIRVIRAQGTSFDRFTLFGFGGEIHGKVPSGLSLSTNSEFLLQLTDMTRGGTLVAAPSSPTGWVLTQELHPNHFDRGWFPNDTDPHTNITFALHYAIDTLRNTSTGNINSQCPLDAQKFIILATDGLADKAYLEKNPASFSSDTLGWDNHKIERDTNGYLSPDYYYSYKFYEKYLIRENSAKNPLAKQLRENQIAVSVLHGGSYIEPNFLNIVDWTIPGSSPANGPFLSIEKGFALGGRGLNIDTIHQSNTFSFADISSTLPLKVSPFLLQQFPFSDECADVYDMTSGMLNPAAAAIGDKADRCAYNLAGQVPGVIFRRPTGTMMALADTTKGYYCPLQPVYTDPSCYDSSTLEWKPGGAGCSRTALEGQTKSPLGTNMGGQSIACTTKILGAPPYSLASSQE